MISRKVSLGLLIGALLTVPAMAADKTEDGAAADPTKGKVCRRVVPTGSIMGKSVCASAKKWKEYDEQVARERQRNGATRQNQGQPGVTTG